MKWHHRAVARGRFIVSTGRCGSTLLGSLLGTHPSVLNVSELFSALQPDAFPEGTIDGGRFWALLSEPREDWSTVIRERAEPPELVYPLDGGGRFDRTTGVPPIAAICLPTLSDEPDRLYAELEEVVPSFPPAPIGAMYESLLRWLGERLGRPLWIERSGGSLAYCGKIAAAFEGARFVHLYRDGCDTALSMSRHVFFRAALADGGDPPLERFGHRWSATILLGTDRLAALAPADVLHLSLADLVASPRATLERLVEFFELPAPPPDWLDRTAARVTPRPRPSVELPRAERERLERACTLGERRLLELARR
jgi:hypothetical protein